MFAKQDYKVQDGQRGSQNILFGCKLKQVFLKLFKANDLIESMIAKAPCNWRQKKKEKQVEVC